MHTSGNNFISVFYNTYSNKNKKTNIIRRIYELQFQGFDRRWSLKFAIFCIFHLKSAKNADTHIGHKCDDLSMHHNVYV